MELPRRKANRLLRYDYKNPGCYFVTICTMEKRKMFWESEQLMDGRPVLSEAGAIAENCIREIPQHYPRIRVEQYNVMPNHVHIILRIEEGNTVPLSKIVGQMKQAVSHALGHGIWQKSYHDHVIRCEKDYMKIWNYVAYNHLKWKEDCFCSDSNGYQPATKPL